MNRVEHLLTIIAEEGAEVGKAACKALRFGLYSAATVDDETINSEDLRDEVLDLIGSYQMLAMEGHAKPLTMCDVGTARDRKAERVERFMALSKEKGALQE